MRNIVGTCGFLLAVAVAGCCCSEKCEAQQPAAEAASVVSAPKAVYRHTYEITPAELPLFYDRMIADQKADGDKATLDFELILKPGVYDFGILPNRDGRRSAPAHFGFEGRPCRVSVRGATGNPADVILDGGFGKSRAFSFATDRGSEVSISGLTFRNFELTDPRFGGAALALSDWMVTNTIADCTFANNRVAGDGGAVSGGNFVRCRFENNLAKNGGAARSARTFQDCVMANNLAQVNGGAAVGGAFTNCVFDSNRALTGDCGAVRDCYRLNGCTFRNNSAPKNYPLRGWAFRFDQVNYGFGGNPANHPGWVTNCTVESWNFGTYGKFDGPTKDSIYLKSGGDILAARDFLRANRTPGGRAEILLGPGIYPLTNCVELVGFDHDLTIRSTVPGQAVITGGWTFRGSDFQKSAARPGLLEITVPENLRTNFWDKLGGAAHQFGGRTLDPHRGDRWEMPAYPLFSVNGQPMTPGRWPKDGRFFFCASSNIVQEAGKGDTNTLFTTFTGRELTWNWQDGNIWLWGENGCAFSKEYLKPLGIDDKTKTIDFGKRGVNGGGRFYFLNILEETDEPGEWCYERSSGKLYLCPPKGFGPDARCVLGTLFDSMFYVYSSGIRFEGVAFEGKIGGAAVHIEEGFDNHLLGCRFSALGQRGVNVYGHDNEVRSCDFYDILYQACNISGGDYVNMIPGSNRVVNCSFRNCCYAQCAGHSPVLGVGGCGNTVAHNQIWDSNCPGIGMGGADNLIEYNRLWAVTKENGDSSAMGTGGTCEGYGNIIRFNDVAGSPGYSHGVYYDDFSAGAIIYGNVIHDIGQWGIFLGGGRDHVISNNVITATWGGVHTDNRGQFWPSWRDKKAVWRDIVKRFQLPNSPFAKKYPKLCRWWDESDNGKQLCSPTGLEVVNNLFLDITGYSSLAFIALDRGFPESANFATNNLVVRPVGIRPGAYDLASSDASKAPTNTVSGGVGVEALRRYFPVRVLDGTPEEPIDMGFVKVPAPKFDLSDCMFMREGWLDTVKFNEARKTGRFDNVVYERGDFNLKPDARIFKEIPGFAPIPWDKIGLYKDEWRKSL